MGVCCLVSCRVHFAGQFLTYPLNMSLELLISAADYIERRERGKKELNLHNFDSLVDFPLCGTCKTAADHVSIYHATLLNTRTLPVAKST